MRFLILLISGLFLATLSACSTTPGEVISVGPRYDVVAADMDVYKLAAGDKLRVTVYDEPTLSGEFTVGSNGTISFPLIGDVIANDKTSNDVAQTIQARLANGYLRDPQVSAEVTGYRPFFILGEVNSPGQYPYAAGLTALNAVATAQGFTPRASTKVAYIRRAGGVEEQAYELTPDLRILPGDTIRIGERYF